MDNQNAAGWFTPGLNLEELDHDELDENENYVLKVADPDHSKPQHQSNGHDSSSSDVPPKLIQPYMYTKLVESFNELNARVVPKLETEWTELNNVIDHKEKQLAQLVSLHSNPVCLFGEEMITLKKMIEKNEHLFNQVPKGPLGSCISVRSASWIPLIECILYPYLFIFLVSNKVDYDLLLKMIDKVYGKHPVSVLLDAAAIKKKPDVWITRFTRLRRYPSNTRVPCGFDYTTLMDMLEFHERDADIFNTLHDFISFEKIILFNKEEDAFRRMSNSFRLPRNCYLGYTKNFLKVFPHPHFRTISMYKYATTFQNTPWSNHLSQSRIQYESSIARTRTGSLASSKLTRDRLNICQRGVKFRSSFMQPHLSSSSYHTKETSPSVPNLIKLKCNEVIDLKKVSQYYLLPSLKTTIKALKETIEYLQNKRRIRELTLQLNQGSRLNILSQLELVEAQLEMNQSGSVHSIMSP